MSITFFLILIIVGWGGFVFYSTIKGMGKSQEKIENLRKVLRD